MAPLGAARALITTGGADLGKLELIETKSASGSAVVDFTSLGSYEVHFLTYNNLDTSTNSDYTQIRLSNDGGDNFEGGTAYQRGVQYGGTNGAFGPTVSTGTDRFRSLAFSNAGTPMSGYVYFYNLGDSTKYSFITQHSTIGTIYMYFGGQVYAVAETINAIRVFNNSAGNFTSGSVSLYGIAGS
tara:strand:+ start:118 stop:672 length:555 start_codon:yes stop_codon:yes gene_type:complete